MSPIFDNHLMMQTDGHLPGKMNIRSIIVAVAGERPNQNKIMNTNQFSLANRKQLADMLGDKYDGLRYRMKQKFRARWQSLRDSFVLEYAEKKGAGKLLSQINGAKAKIEELEAELCALGFDLDTGGLALRDSNSNPLDKLIDDRIEKEIGTEDAIDARFDSAQIAMMTVATLEDADKLLKSVSAI